jgi:hypothetical protein
VLVIADPCRLIDDSHARPAMRVLSSRAPGSITISSTRTRSFCSSSRCEPGAAISASSSGGLLDPGALMSLALAGLPGRAHEGLQRPGKMRHRQNLASGRIAGQPGPSYPRAGRPRSGAYAVG